MNLTDAKGDAMTKCGRLHTPRRFCQLAQISQSASAVVPEGRVEGHRNHLKTDPNLRPLPSHLLKFINGTDTLETQSKLQVGRTNIEHALLTPGIGRIDASGAQHPPLKRQSNLSLIYAHMSELAEARRPQQLSTLPRTLLIRRGRSEPFFGSDRYVHYCHRVWPLRSSKMTDLLESLGSIYVGVSEFTLARYQPTLAGGSCCSKGAFIMGPKYTIQYYSHMPHPDTLPEWKAKLLSQYYPWNLGDREGIILNVRVWRPLEVIGPTVEPSSWTLAICYLPSRWWPMSSELLKFRIDLSTNNCQRFNLYGCSTRRQDGCTEMDTDNTTVR